MSEIPPAPSPRKETIALRQESLSEEFADDPPGAGHNYGEVRLWLVARDARCLFAYWDFRPEEHANATGAEGRSRFSLRIFREGRGEATMEIDCGAGNVFIPAQSPDSAYFAELGFFASDVWCFLARSGITRTPPELSAARESVIFATIPARIGLGKLRDTLAPASLPGERLAAAAARIQRAARLHGVCSPEQERLLGEMLGENVVVVAAPANSLTLTRRIQRKLGDAAKAAAPFPPIPAPDAGDDASSHVAGWLAGGQSSSRT
jgi:hypothetical protein